MQPMFAVPGAPGEDDGGPVFPAHVRLLLLRGAYHRQQTPAAGHLHAGGSHITVPTLKINRKTV